MMNERVEMNEEMMEQVNGGTVTWETLERKKKEREAREAYEKEKDEK